MEKLVSEPEYYKTTFEFLTQLEPTQEYLDEVFKEGSINKHVSNKAKSPEEQYNLWNDWQREAFITFFNLSGIGDKYAKEGYDFSFLTN